jgi:hypothetical protein
MVKEVADDLQEFLESSNPKGSTMNYTLHPLLNQKIRRLRLQPPTGRS